MRNLITLILTLFSFSTFAQPFPIPDDKEVSYDVIRKKKDDWKSCFKVY